MARHLAPAFFAASAATGLPVKAPGELGRCTRGAAPLSARPPSRARTTPNTTPSRTSFRLDVHARLAPALRLARDTPGGACTRRTGGHLRERTCEMKPTSVTPTLAPREADDTAICARKSLAGTSRREYRPETSPPAARDGRGRLRRDGPRARLGSCSGRSSSSRSRC